MLLWVGNLSNLITQLKGEEKQGGFFQKRQSVRNPNSGPQLGVRGSVNNLAPINSNSNNSNSASMPYENIKSAPLPSVRQVNMEEVISVLTKISSRYEDIYKSISIEYQSANTIHLI
jgi:hypothetical protein